LCYSPKLTFASRVTPTTTTTTTNSSIPTLPKTRVNPFRAFLIVNRFTSAIISCNRQACEYFWYTEDELKTKTIDQLMSDEKSSSVISESFLSQQSGQTKILAGKIVQILLGTGERGRFSLFMQDFDGDQGALRFYAFEPIHLMQIKITCDRHGFICSTDQHFSLIFENNFIERDEEKRHISDVIPTFKDSIKWKQFLTSHRTYRTTGLLNSEKNLCIPLMINLLKRNNDEETISFIISIMSNISGLMMLDENYTIRAYNPYFIQSLFGYRSLDLINHVSSFRRSSRHNLSL
jgi:hypothetical protein